MKKLILVNCFLLATASITSAQKDEFPKLSGLYLGQTPPGTTPEIFAPSIVSTSRAEHGSPVFSPDGEEIYWFSWPGPITQMMRLENGQWTAPETINLGTNPTISPDGKKIFFGRRESGRRRIGYCERTDTGWSEKKWLDPLINNANTGWEIWMTKSGTTYFSSNKAGGFGGSDICKASFVDGKYTNIENLGPDVNSAYGDWGENGGFVAPDESYLIFSSDRPGGYGGNDLYICFRNKSGSWTRAVNMGSSINNAALQLWPYVSPDGKFLFFITHENGTQDIYWVSAKIIEELKPKVL